MPLSHLRHSRRNLLVNDTVIIKVKVDVLSEPAPHSDPHIGREIVDVQIVKETSDPPNAPPVFDSYRDVDLNGINSTISKLEEFIITSSENEGSNSRNHNNGRMGDFMSDSPSLKETEEAKQYLKECLSGIFKLDM
ncbi:hypothetical protein SAY87_027349 [Trapa incisa]|uniref:MATH domain-containing protein n=1 Tax=Trapa incisa TaxID=236973 RepID=A0AAN7GN84_9MYRT|nr:hypothetical protein SAY87_027349 [Trapa incisa]